ncbi:aromatic-L-amino-acid decarboxylase-like [Antedon mediterranea]|uniref:aromatic-L-amino-acid decarboxylase-like n=1 Tax=Antedon mediterranea TaxID=105859 RepID=UPI003AF61D96
MDAEEYRERGKEMVDYIYEYLTTIRQRKVIPNVAPGYMRKIIADKPPQKGENWEEIFQDIERVIMPGVVHWQSPHMHAYFPALNSFPSLLGDMLSDAINCLGFTWASSPACTELEMNVMDWLGELIGLPAHFLHKTSGSFGGGVIQGTLSESTFVAMLAARASAIKKARQLIPEFEDMEEAVICSRLVAYCSDQAHSSMEKDALLTMVKLRSLETDDNLSLRGPTLQKAIDEDRSKGLIPFFICATLGTTGACAFDNLEEMGKICSDEDIWLHTDAAYAGTAFICPEYQHLMKGVEHAQSFAFNPSKWMMVNFDCTAMWVSDSRLLHNTFCVNPLYLQHDNEGDSVDYMHWQIPLSRRFRSIKLWFVMRSFGIEGLQEHIRKGVKLAKFFEDLVRQDCNFVLAAKRVLGLVVIRLKESCELTAELLRRLNNSGKLYAVPASVKGRYVIRFTVTSQYTEESDIVKDWQFIRTTARELLMEKSIEYITSGTSDIKIVIDSTTTEKQQPIMPTIEFSRGLCMSDDSDIDSDFSEMSDIMGDDFKNLAEGKCGEIKHLGLSLSPKKIKNKKKFVSKGRMGSTAQANGNNYTGVVNICHHL